MLNEGGVAKFIFLRVESLMIYNPLFEDVFGFKPICELFLLLNDWSIVFSKPSRLMCDVNLKIRFHIHNNIQIIIDIIAFKS